MFSAYENSGDQITDDWRLNIPTVGSGLHKVAQLHMLAQYINECFKCLTLNLQKTHSLAL